MDFPGHFDQVFQQLNYQRVHGQLCDCVIVVGSRHFKAHRSVLAACSTHFRALFTVAEGDASMSMIQLDAEVVTAEAFSALMDMMYTSTLMLGESNVMDVLLAASHLHLNAVVKACKHYLTTRTLPLSPGNAAQHSLHHPEAPLGGAVGIGSGSNSTSAGSSSRLQRSFLLQQLGLSLVSSALSSGLVEEGREGAGVEQQQQQLQQQRNSFPNRRLHKRKPNLSLMGSEAERARQRLRPTPGPDALLCGGDGGGSASAESGLLSPDSNKLGEDSKPDIVAGVVAMDTVASSGNNYGRRSAAQEDAQMPSQSDGGRGGSGGEPEPVGKEEYMDGDAEGHLHGDGQEKEAEDDDKMQVVVKSEPVSSPEPPDASPLEGADQSQPCMQKSELSPAESERSYSTPQPSTERLPRERERAGEVQGSDGLEPGSPGFRISSFMGGRSFGEEVLSGGTASSSEGRFLLGPSDGVNSSPSSSSSLLLPSPHMLQGEHSQGFGETQAESLFLRPMHDSALGLQRAGAGADTLTLDFQRSSLGLHSLPRPPRSHNVTAATLGFPGYRRIAPKTALGGSQQQDPSSSSSSSSSSLSANSSGAMLLNGATPSGAFDGGSGLPNHPQLTRASADVLSKCKKALSEHNVLVVEGARKYACKICCKTFLTLTDCKKHIRVHTGEKPYACLKCGKRFSQSSHLYKHSKTTCLRWQNSNLPNTLL